MKAVHEYVEVVIEDVQEFVGKPVQPLPAAGIGLFGERVAAAERSGDSLRPERPGRPGG